MNESRSLPAISSIGRRSSRTLTEEAVGALAAPIRAGQLKPGDKLPTESEIMRLLGVSRTVVREAISRLQANGLVETRHGIGTFVSQPPEPPLHIPFSAVNTVMDALALLELREAVEVEAAILAARRRSTEQLAHMREILNTLLALENDLESEAQKAIDADYAFHQAIAEATGNPYFQEFLTHLGRAAIPRSRLNMDAATHRRYLRTLNREHNTLFLAIEAQNEKAAARAAREHLNKSRLRLERALEEQRGKNDAGNSSSPGSANPAQHGVASG
ncbi:MAG TPA: FadR/GntR family transcriptional regulator [Burkholderiaceae bacterium]|nr:FadR/GntR family transcriptional regulator [Burkholderiaceae bacterium]